MKTILTLALLLSVSAWGQKVNGSTTAAAGSTQDNSAATITRPFVTLSADPATCTAGKDAYINNASTPVLKICTATNTWTAVGTGSGTIPGTVHAVSFSATPTLTGSSLTLGTVDTFIVGQLSASITGITLSTLTPGQTINIDFQQAASGGPYSVTYGSGFLGACTVSPYASAHTKSTWYINSSGVAVLVGGCPSDSGPGYSGEIARSGVATPPSATDAVGVDSTSHIPFAIDPSGNKRTSVLELASGSVRCAGGANADDSAITLSTTGTSGAASLTGCALNIPQYSGGGSASPVPSWLAPYGFPSGAYATLSPAPSAINLGQYFEVLVPYPMTVNYVSAESNGSTSGHTAWTLWNAACTSAIATTNTLNALTGNVVTSWTFAGAPLTVAAGKYFLMFTSDATSTQFYAAPLGSIADFLNTGESASNYHIFVGNPSTGTTTLVPPSSCGTRTTPSAFTGNNPTPPAFAIH